MDRYLKPHLLEFSSKKIILLTGPRQVGKTTLAKDLLGQSLAYYNYDVKDNYNVFKKNEWDRTKKLVIFDELHKMKNWKLWLKGLYDDGVLKKQAILVTGSARLNIVKKMGDSLAGRFFSYQLYPLDLQELKGHETTQKNYQKLLRFGGFPEPFFEGSEKFYGQWKRSHIDMILRQDLLNFEVVKDLDSLEVLIYMMTKRVASPLSYHSLSEDLQKDEKTIKKWIGHLENLYVVFKVPPFHGRLERAMKKMGKYYFYDISRVQGETPEEKESLQLENLVALSLKKHIDFKNEVLGKNYSLHFIRLKGDKEIDFLICNDGMPKIAIEVKLSDSSPSMGFKIEGQLLKTVKKIQLVKNLKRPFTTPEGVSVISALDFLENIVID